MAVHVLLRGYPAGKAGHESPLVLLVGIQPRHPIFLLDIFYILALNKLAIMPYFVASQHSIVAYRMSYRLA